MNPELTSAGTLVSRKTRARARRVAVLSIALASAVLWPAALRAGHYDLEDVEEIVPTAERQRFVRVGITSTRAIVERLASVPDRRRVARESGISLKRLTDLVHFCDLLRVNGVGPRMARLLQAAGVLDVVMLRREEPEALMVRVTAANEIHRITEMPPAAEHLRGWIARARELPIVVE